MTTDEIIAFVESLGDVLTLSPASGDSQWPEISWGDSYFYYSPEQVIPTRTQPFATIVTKNYPDEPRQPELDRPGGFRVNIAVDADTFSAHVDRDPFVAHPTYPRWLSATNPADGAGDAVRELLRRAHDRARSRHRPSWSVEPLDGGLGQS